MLVAWQAEDAPSGSPSAAPETESIAEAKTLGTEPEGSSIAFLRRQTPLLRRGESQLDFGITYTIAETDLPVGLVGDGGFLTDVLPGRVTHRLLLVPLELRYGWSERLQLYVNVPFGWANSEQSFVGLDDFSNHGGVSDIRFGGNYLWKQGDGYSTPDIVFTLGGTAPAGRASLLTTSFAPQSQLGEGFWAISANFLLINTYDPIVVFYGLGARHRFDATLDGVRVNPGEQCFYQLGVGFAVNESTTLSAACSGAYIADNLFDNQRLAGSSLEPVQMRFAVTISQRGLITEPFAIIGATRDAASWSGGISWTF